MAATWHAHHAAGTRDFTRSQFAATVDRQLQRQNPVAVSDAYADDQKITLAGLSSVGIRLFLVTYDAQGLRAEQSIVVPQLPPASQVLADVMLSHWPISAWQPQLPAGWTLRDNGDKRELRNASGKLVTEITYLNRQGKRVPISIEQHVFKYHITIQYLGD